MSRSAEDNQSYTDLEQLEEAILIMEAQRDHLGDAVVDTIVTPLREKLITSRGRQATTSQQRKFVTILFADMVGWTALSQRLELEDMMALTDGAIRRFNRIIERRGGKVLNFMGDGLMAVFGIPQLQEDDAERAIQAGLDILNSARIYAQVLEERWNLSGFNVRVGLNTGPIIMGGGMEGERTAIGMTVNLAARMESTAPAGGMRITHATYQQVRGMFEVEAQPLLRVKGKDQPLVTYLVKQARPRSFRMNRHGIRGIETPFIGRQAEFDQLLSSFKSTVQSARANFVTIVGEPGIGKSRLMLEFETWLSQQQALVHSFRGRGFQSIQDSPYGVLRMLIAQYCHIQDSDDLSAVHQKLETGLSPFFAEDSLMKTHFIGALLGYNFDESPYLTGVLEQPQELRARALHYLVQLFSKAIGDGLTVILIEDIHWADDPTLKFLLNLAESFANQLLIIVCTARPELYARHPKWPDSPGKRELDHTRLDLGPLSDQASHLLVNEILGRAEAVPTGLVNAIVRQSDGNPYYVEELVRMLIDDGVIVRLGAGDSWRIDMSKLSNVRVPDTLKAVMLSRLDNLASAERLFLQHASVAGRSFWISLVNDVSGGALHQADILPSLIDNGLIYLNEESTFTGKEEFVFEHALLREAVYESILIGDRQIYHGRVADWLKSTADSVGRVDEFVWEIAEHYDLADLPDPAADYYLLAGEKAKRQGVPAEAIRALERALELMGAEKSDRHWRAMLAKTSVMGWLGRLEEQLTFNQLLVDQAHRDGDDDHLADAYCRLGFTIRGLGRYQEEAQAYETAIQAARRAKNKRVEAMSLSLLAVCLLRQGHFKRAESVAQQAHLLAADLGDDVIRANTLSNVAHYYSDSGDMDKAVRLFSEIVEICSEIGLQHTETANRLNLGYNYLLLGLPELASITLQEATQLTQRIGAPHYEAYCHLNLGLVYLRLGDQERAQTTLEMALIDLETFGDLGGQASGNLYLGFVLEQEGAYLAALDRFRQARDIFEEVGTIGYANDARAGLARCFLNMGDLVGAKQEASRIWDYLTETGSGGMEFPALAYQSCADVFAGLDQEAWTIQAVSAGYTDLMARAERIEDDAWRRSFLHNVKEHQALRERWNALDQSPGDEADAESAAGRIL